MQCEHSGDQERTKKSILPGAGGDHEGNMFKEDGNEVGDTV